jgi:hypothetical protein
MKPSVAPPQWLDNLMDQTKTYQISQHKGKKIVKNETVI